MYENSKLTERILDRPFTVKSFTYQDNMAIISVEGLKDMFIDVDEDFRIDAAGTSLGQRQKDYLGRYYYDISKKLMELSGMSSDQIEAHLKKLKTERTMNTEDFLRKFKPNYKGLIYDFSKYVEIYHISARWSDYAVYTEKVLKESWEEFYRGSNWDGQRFCHFRPEKYLGIIGKRDVVDLNEWTKFADSNIGYGLGIGSGPTYYSLKSLDEAFEEFESSLGKVEESIESKFAENFANELKNLQKEGLFENVKSFDLDFTGRGINIKLNESRPGNRNVSFKKRSNLKENETNEVTYAQDFLGEDIDISELKEAAAEAGISLEIYEGSGNNGCDEIYVTASSEEALKEFLYDWWLIENDDDFEAGLLD